MTMIGTKTVGTKAIGTKSWQFGSGSGRQGEPGVARPRDGARDEMKLLAKSKASLAESERMLTRQTTLLAELRAGGLVTTEVEKSVARLEAALLAQQSAHAGLLAKAGAGTDAAHAGR